MKKFIDGYEYYKSLPTKRMGTGVIFFDEEGNFLIVKPNYKDYWSIPGGVIDEEESPKDGALREVKEEIDLEIDDITFLAVEYYRSGNAPEKKEVLHFIFYGGVLNKNQIENIKIPDDELDEYKFVPFDEALLLVSKKMKLRLEKSMEALKGNTALYIESDW